MIEAEAKRRLADEIDAAQERGEVSRGGGRPDCVDDPNAVPATAADLGLRRAEMRLAEEYDAAQERGEAATAGVNQHSEVVVSANDLGLTHKQVHVGA